MTLGGAAQVVTSNCPNVDGLWTPHSAAITDPTYAPASHTMAFIPQCSPATAPVLTLLHLRSQRIALKQTSRSNELFSRSYCCMQFGIVGRQ